jgi:6-phosphogluconolactonase
MTRSDGSSPPTGLDGSARTSDAAQKVDGSDPRPADAARDGGRVGPTSDATPGVDASGDGEVAPSEPLETLVYVGGYGSPYPLRVYELDRSTYALTKRGESTDMGANPAYIAVSKSGQHLYIANEAGGEAGVTVAKIDDVTGLLTKLEREPFAGDGLVFTSVDSSGKYVLAASYDDSTALSYKIEADGKLSAPVDTKTFASGWHSHSIRVHASGRWAYVPNKDAAPESIAQFAFDSATGKLSPLTPANVPAPGGPRHLAFHPTLDIVYVLMEYTGVVRAFSISAQGTLSELDSKPSLPAGFTQANTGAHVLVHPNGKYLYASNRGHDQLAVFSLAADGKLTLVQHAPTGKTPRNFDIDSRGELLIAAGQGDGSLTVYTIGSDGKLTKRGNPLTGLTQPCAVAIVHRPKR